MSTSGRLVYMAGGGTGGHLVPGIALADMIAGTCGDTTVRFLCQDSDLDRELLAKARYPHQPIAKRRGTGMVQGLRHMVSLLRAYLACRRLFFRTSPDLVIGLGGGGSFPAVLAAIHRHVPVVLLEQNVIPGRVTRLCATRAHRILSQWRQTADYLPRRIGFVWTGSPSPHMPMAAGRPPEVPDGLSANRFTVLVMGGSQGANGVNQLAMKLLGWIRKHKGRIQMIHLTGKSQYDDIRTRYRALPDVPAYVSAFEDDMPGVYSMADVAITRGGGLSLAELASWGIPSVVVPYPHAKDDHQRANARVFCGDGAGIIWEETQEGTADVETFLQECMEDPEKRKEKMAKARSLFPDRIQHGMIREIQRVLHAPSASQPPSG